MRITIDPLTRIEGHLSVSLNVSSNRISAAYCAGTMFRGFETILQGRDPLDAIQITQRICGVCPVDHGVAASLCAEDALGLEVPDNARLIRNLVLAASHIQSHLIHFYQLTALDFVDVAAVLAYNGQDRDLLTLRGWVEMQVKSKVTNAGAPFLPRYDGDYIADPNLNLTALHHYLQALQMHRLGQEMISLFGGKMPHASALVPGGTTVPLTVSSLAGYRARLQQVYDFIVESYVPDVLAVAQAYPQYFTLGRGPGNYLAYGVFPEATGNTQPFLARGVLRGGKLEAMDPARITEDVRYTWFEGESGQPPLRSQTRPQAGKTEAYSWVKAPRYAGTVVEVGPLARLLVTHAAGTNAELSRTLTAALRQNNLTLADLNSAMGRHLARALECKLVAERCLTWLEQIQLGSPSLQPVRQIPDAGTGLGLTEAARGALGHWVEISGQTIRNYACVVPTTWNCSPRDAQEQPGAVEHALEGIPIADASNPIEAVRVVHAFDPCLACAVH